MLVHNLLFGLHNSEKHKKLKEIVTKYFCHIEHKLLIVVLKPTFLCKTTGYDSKINEILFLDQALIQKPELSFCTDRHEEKTELFLWSGTVHTKLSAKIITDHRFAWNPVQPVQQPPHWTINKKLTTTTTRRPWRRLFL